MRILNNYIYRSLIVSFSIITIFFILLIWSNDMFQRAETLIFQYHADFKSLFFISLLLIPSLLVEIISVTFFIAVIYTILNLRNTSELTIMLNGGMSKFQLAQPFIFVVIILSILNLLNSGYVMPKSFSKLKEQSHLISTNLSKQIILAKEFKTIDGKYTLYAEQINNENEIIDFFGHISKHEKNLIINETYIARQALISMQNNQLILFLRDGNIVRDSYYLHPSTQENIKQNNNKILTNKQLLGTNIAKFDEMSINLGTRLVSSRIRKSSINEYNLYELFTLNNDNKNLSKNQLRAEGHKRISGFFYMLITTLMCLKILSSNLNVRRDNVKLVLITVFVGVTIKVFSILIKQLAGNVYFANYLHYIVTLSLCGIYFIPNGFFTLPKFTLKT